MPQNNLSNWWESFFTDAFADTMLEHSKDDIAHNKAVDFLMEELHLKPSSIVFDQCCGTGSVSIDLAKKGVYAIGVDQSALYIERANKKLQTNNLKGEFFTGDALTFKPTKQCDAAFNWYTSFGYYSDDSKNLEMLKSAYNAIKSGGFFALEYVNVANILASKPPYSKVISKKTPQNMLITNEVDIDINKDMLNQHWTFTTPNGNKQTYHGAIKMYHPHQIKKLLEKCGFTEIKTYGNTAKQELTANSSRCIFVCRKGE